VGKAESESPAKPPRRKVKQRIPPGWDMDGTTGWNWVRNWVLGRKIGFLLAFLGINWDGKFGFQTG
jgi:hypothetical protein